MPPSPPLWDQPTIRLNKSEVTLFQSLGEPTQRRACLVLYNGEDTGKRFALDSELLFIGRSTDCEIHVDSPGLSRRHAELSVQGDLVELNDLGSSNGTHLNGTRLTEPTPLKDGDLIRLGNLVFKFFERQSLDALLHDRIYRLATIDAGTEVFSKRFVLDALEREIKVAQRSARPLSIVCLDLDFFKNVNDSFGHNAGDVVLREAAAVVQATVRGTDTVGRIGGEEFVVVLPDTELGLALELAERVRAAMAGHAFALQLPDGAGQRTVTHHQTVSLGVAQWLAGMHNGRDLLGAADALLYAAKRSGRNRVNG